MKKMIRKIFIFPIKLYQWTLSPLLGGRDLGGTSGETIASGWLRDVMVDRMPTTDLRRWLFAPLAEPPVAAPSRGRVVCNCLNVAERDIRAAVVGGADLAALQETLKCGTSCGSCVPELRRMVAAGAAT